MFCSSFSILRTLLTFGLVKDFSFPPIVCLFLPSYFALLDVTGVCVYGTVYLYILLPHSFPGADWLLPRDASAERGNATVSRLSVRLSVRL